MMEKLSKQQLFPQCFTKCQLFYEILQNVIEFVLGEPHLLYEPLNLKIKKKEKS